MKFALSLYAGFWLTYQNCLVNEVSGLHQLGINARIEPYFVLVDSIQYQ
jgi:hypothetical protein